MDPIAGSAEANVPSRGSRLLPKSILFAAEKIRRRARSQPKSANRVLRAAHNPKCAKRECDADRLAIAYAYLGRPLVGILSVNGI